MAASEFGAAKAWLKHGFSSGKQSWRNRWSWVSNRHTAGNLVPLSTTHALVPIAAAVAFGRRPVPWMLVVAAAAAAAAPDLDAVAHRFFHIPFTSVYSHRGFTHSLFVAIAVGCLASIFHRRLAVRPLTAGVVVGASIASHGILDMMTDRGLRVAYLWPLTSERLSADWRPISAPQLQLAHLASELLPRLWSELWQLILPMFAAALAIRSVRMLIASRLDPSARSPMRMAPEENPVRVSDGPPLPSHGRRDRKDCPPESQ